MSASPLNERVQRQSGRPAGLRAGVLQDALLDAAEECFGEQGFDATPVRQVAEMAGVNPALVHYYFGTKEQLLTAVLDRAFEPLADAVAALGTAREIEPQAILPIDNILAY